MSDERAPVLALTKTVRGDRTATVHIEWLVRYGGNSGTVVSVSRLDGKEIGNHCGAHHLKSGLPAGYVAAVGQLALTQAEADQVQAAYDAFRAALPRDLHAERRALVARIHEAEDRWADNRSEQWGRVDRDYAPTGLHDPEGEQRIGDAQAALAAFDAEHPEVVAEVLAKRHEETLRSFQ